MQPKRGISTVKAGLATELMLIRHAPLQGDGAAHVHGDCPSFVAATGGCLCGRAALATISTIPALGAVPEVLRFGIGRCPA